MQKVRHLPRVALSHLILDVQYFGMQKKYTLPVLNASACATAPGAAPHRSPRPQGASPGPQGTRRPRTRPPPRARGASRASATALLVHARRLLLRELAQPHRAPLALAPRVGLRDHHGGAPKSNVSTPSVAKLPQCAAGAVDVRVRQMLASPQTPRRAARAARPQAQRGQATAACAGAGGQRCRAGAGRGALTMKVEHWSFSAPARSARMRISESTVSRVRVRGAGRMREHVAKVCRPLPRRARGAARCTGRRGTAGFPPALRSRSRASPSLRGDRKCQRKKARRTVLIISAGTA